MYLKNLILVIFSLYFSSEMGQGVPVLTEKFLGLRSDLHQGDMNITEEQEKNGIIGENYRWPGGVIVYAIDPAFSNAEMNQIFTAMNEISSKTCIRWLARYNYEKDFVYIVRGGPGSGCWAHVGRIGGRQTVNLEAPGCVYSAGPIPHELMHTIGFHHEHVRQDRDDYVRVLWQNIDPTQWSNFNKVPGTTTFGFPYDYVSIMQYPRRAFSINGYDTVQPIPNNNVPFGNYDHLSTADAQKVNVMYKGVCPGL